MSNLWHVKNWFRVGKNISWKLNFHTLFGVMYLYMPNNFSLKESEKKHTFILSFLKSNYKNVIDKYKLKTDEVPSKPERRYIWTLWWQGEKNAPPLVSTCLKKMRENANGAEVIVLSKDNYEQYITIPKYIIEKREKGYISFAQLSDIFRFTLLEKYGGLWLDSTVYTSKPIPEDYFEKEFYSQHTKWQPTCFVQHNLYHGFIIGSQKGGKLVSFVKEIFFEYWKENDTLIDYLLIDYLIMIAYTTFQDIKEEIDNLPYSSERLYDLVKLLNKPYNYDTFKSLTEDCIFSKLDWHKKYKTHKNSKETFYSFITTNK